MDFLALQILKMKYKISYQSIYQTTIKKTTGKNKFRTDRSKKFSEANRTQITLNKATKQPTNSRKTSINHQKAHKLSKMINSQTLIIKKQLLKNL